MRLHLILLTGIAAIVVACGGSTPSQKLHNVVVDPTQNSAIKLNDYFVLDSVITLKNAIVASISKLIPTQNGYVVHGSSDQGELLYFSSDGTFQGQLIQIGRGPNEAINIIDVTVDCDGNLLVLTNFGQQIMVYAPDQKRILRTITLPMPYIARNIEKLDSVRYVLHKDLSYSEEPEYKITLFNEQTQQVEQNFLPLDKQATEYIFFSQRNNLFRHTDGKVYFYEAFNDTIYHVTSNSLNPFLVFDKGEFGIPNKKLEGFSDLSQFVNFCKDSPYIWAQIDCFRCGDMFVSRYNYRNQTYLNLADAATGLSVSGTELLDDLLSDSSYQAKSLTWAAAKGEHLYWSVESEQGLHLVRLKAKTSKGAIL